MPFSTAAVAGPLADAPRRCFICLTDEEATDPKGSWVDPCPCTLEAHQDCMLSWVTDCERSNKPLRCPVCKAQIELEGPWDPVASLHDALQRHFTRASPFILLTGASVGVQFGLQMYGAVALWTFAGKRELLRFVFGSDAPAAGSPSATVRFARQRIVNALILMNVAPALLVSQLLPGLSNKYLMQSASVYGVFTMMRDENFLEWPPSPRLAMVALPIIRRIYWTFWKDYVLPYEVRLNRQIVGLPPVEEAEPPAPGNNRRPPERAGEGGFIGLIQNILDVLDPEDDDFAEAAAAPDHDNVDADGINVNMAADEVMVEVIIQEVDAAQQADDQDDDDDDDDDDDVAHDGPDHQHGQQQQQQQHEQQHGAHQREAAQPPPARRLGLGGLLHSVSNSIVSALLLPVVSFAMGEALKLVLPRSWTALPGRSSRLFASVAGRPGLLQQQWGRSLVGGCLYVVLSDILRVYSKSRKVAAMNSRRVKNSERKRRRSD